MSFAPEKHQVVIVGGGFAGLHAAKRLGQRGYAVTLLDKRNFQLFQPLLYQVATGSLSTGDIAIPQRVVLRKHANVRCLATTAFDVDPQAKLLKHEFGELRYDTLIVATGVKHHYFGREEWREFAPGLKTLEHALEMRRKIFSAFERAELTDDEALRRELLTFVVVGAGPTGVELAGAIGELAHKTMKRDFRGFDPREARVLLIEGARDVLPVFEESLRKAARGHLEQLGVTVITETMVEDIGADYVKTKKGEVRETIRTQTILWAAGVRASLFGEILAQRVGASLDRGGRVQVEPDCTLPGHPEIFVVGDLGRLTDSTGREVPGLAPAAMQEGRYVADLLHARLTGGKTPKPFKYADRGTMAVIGMNKAVGDLNFMKVTGWFAWLTWAFVHIAALVDGAQRLRVFVQWSWKYFTRHIGDRLVTGAPTQTRKLRTERGDLRTGTGG
ncbi:MAG TPA: NAD(P)/FAD-dependent oxidoreductase [Solimonas sp.]|nr:NAD(P)/FAD-dependent oxidoreductase [Solimonas sp.]